MNQEMTMMDYILLQPETMQDIFDKRSELLGDFLAFYQQVKPDHVYIIASGSSYNASCAASVYMSRAMGVDVSVHCPSQVPAIRAARPLVMAVSQGGESTNTIAAIKKVKVNLTFAVISGVLNIILNMLLIPVLGSVGAAFATLIVTIVIAVMDCAYVMHHFKIET